MRVMPLSKEMLEVVKILREQNQHHYASVCLLAAVTLETLEKKSLRFSDVAPIVRCKDCRWWDRNDPDDGYGWCCNAVARACERWEDFYCACGRRMAEE